MLRFLRRALAIATTLSVLSSTLGVAHASCATMAAAPATATHAQHHATGQHDDAQDGEHTAPASHETGTSACPLVIHCSTMLPTAQAEVALATTCVHAREHPANDGGPLELVPEPESPPPRG